MLPIIKKHAYLKDYADHFAGRDFLSSFFSDGADYNVPAVNIKEMKNAFELEIAAPGLAKDDIRISLENDVLTVSSESRATENEEKDHYMRKEFMYQSFNRSFSIPETVDSDNIKASHINGVLSITLPKFEKNNSKKNKSIKIS